MAAINCDKDGRFMSAGLRRLRDCQWKTLRGFPRYESL